MAKGIVAFIICVAFILSISVLSGLGYYADMNVQYSDSADADVERAANAMVGQNASDQSGGSVLQDFTTSAGRTLATGWQVIANLSGILKMLYGAPDVVASSMQTMFQIVFGISFAAFIRGVVLQ
jgi:hypothetical protein